VLISGRLGPALILGISPEKICRNIPERLTDCRGNVWFFPPNIQDITVGYFLPQFVNRAWFAMMGHEILVILEKIYITSLTDPETINLLMELCIIAGVIVKILVPAYD